MKRLRSIIASILAIVMSFTMSATAFADGGHTISLADGDTHTYRVYQVLTGTLSKEGSTELGDPAWGEDVLTSVQNSQNVNDFIASLNATNDQQVIANLVYDVLDLGDPEDPNRGQGVVAPNKPIKNLVTGYYVMVDETDFTDEQHELETSALHVVRVVNDINGITIKWGTTQDEKEIVSDTLGNVTNANPHILGDPDNPGASNDNVSIGDTVNYQITAKIPSNANLYNYFVFVINDKLDAGLTLNDTFTVTVSDGTTLVAGTDYILKTGDAADPYSFQIGLTNAKKYNGKDIIVTYSAVLNENAKIGETANKNESTVTYSNDPNHTYDGTTNPGFPAEDDKDVLGETPATETETYTTGIKIQKTDGNGHILTGAEFTLTGDSIQKVITTAQVFKEATDGNGTHYMLKDGTYTTDDPIVDSMELVAGATEGYVEEDASYAGADKVVVGGVTYRAYTDADAGQAVYILHRGNADQYASEKIYILTTETEVKDSTEEGVEITQAVGYDGIASFVGLGAGEYTIKETVTPNGYNTMADMTVFVEFALDKDGKAVWTLKDKAGTDGTAIGSYDTTDGTLTLEIENNKGTALPSTGGIGTTIFYIVGGIMVAGAVVFLLTKRRIASNE
jgi:fimbrial isopeptide formation D2 family protein/LPXTG-motif cell wall-anchored protein